MEATQEAANQAPEKKAAAPQDDIHNLDFILDIPLRVSVELGRGNGNACIEVRDDGIGGAVPGNGSGLRGLADRVEALGGRLVLESPAGAGTTLRAEIPCS